MKQTIAHSATPNAEVLPSLQRKCACGQCRACQDEDSIQFKLSMGQDGDHLEREADTIAAQVMRKSPSLVNSRLSKSVSSSNSIRRRTRGTTAGNAVPASVHKVINTPGQPLDSSTKAFMEPRFGYDFSHIKIHTDALAQHSAKAVNAQAYTVGHHVVFGSGFYAPHHDSGRELLAHELTHTIQQGHGQVRLSRRGATVGGFFNNIGRAIASMFGDEPDYDDSVLLAYLEGIDRDGLIEDDYDSDNKARAVVGRWRQGNTAFSLTPRLKILLIQEMLSGATLADDENAILALLQGSNDIEIGQILQQVGEANLRSDINDEQGEILDGIISAWRQRRDAGNQQAQASTPAANIGTTGITAALSEYLHYIDVHDAIRNDAQSHAHAREVISRWASGDERYFLPVRRKQLLARELLTGTSSTEDHQALLTLLRGLNGSANDVDLRLLMQDPGESWMQTRMGDQQAQFDELITQWRSRETAAHAPTHSASDRIDRIVVDQEIPQTVTVHWHSGRTDSDMCSTGKGHCCVDENDAQGAACSEAESRESGSNCTPVGRHTVDFTLPESAGGVELWTNFNSARSIALHDYEPRIDGTPLSHGCVRLRRPMAQLIFDGVVPGRTAVEVRGLARPRCNWPALQAEWSGDLRTAGATVDDGEEPAVRRRRQRSIDQQRATEREIFDVNDEELTEQIDQLEQQVGGELPYAGRIWGDRARRVETLNTIGPIADSIPRCVATQTVEERRLQTATEPTAILQASTFERFAAPFERALASARDLAAAEQVVNTHGGQLWQEALARAQGSSANTDDRPLYWARLQMTQVLRQWLPSWSRSARRRTGRSSLDDIRRDKTRLLALFELASRGMNEAAFTNAQDEKRILISGFDPFGLHQNIDRGNPSGAAVLSLDNQTITDGSINAQVQGVIFPVRFGDFNDGMVENFFGPYLSSTQPPNMIMTISQGGGDFEVERFAGRRRSSEEYPDNMDQTSGGTRDNPVEAPGLASGPEFIETTLPASSMRSSLGRSDALPGEREFTEIRPSETRPVLSHGEPTSGARAVRGSGGGYLSNEIFYRVSLLRHQSGLTIPVGHLHTPALPPESLASDFDAQRDAIVARIRELLIATLSDI